MVERPVDLGADGRYLVAVAGDATEIFDETRSFDYYLGGTFAALGIVLLLTTILQVRFGLAPLKRISRIDRRYPLGPRRAAARANSRSRSRRWRARPMR